MSSQQLSKNDYFNATPLRWLLATLLVLAYLGCSLTYYFFWAEENRLGKIEAARIYTAFIGSELKHTVVDNLPATASEQLKLLLTGQHHELFDQQLVQSVTRGALLLPSASLFGYYSSQNVSLPEFNLKTRHKRNEKTLELIEPIFNAKQDSPIAFAYLEFDLALLEKTSLTPLLLILSVFVLLFLLGLKLLSKLKERLIKPLELLTNQLEQITSLEVSDQRLVDDHPDTSHPLTTAINNLLAKVQDREDEQKNQNQQLQRLVKMRTEQLYKKVNFDQLTGLPNRYYLMDRLKHSISVSRRDKSLLAILFLDLDRFKVINDNLGHQNGDQLLKEAANRLSGLTRQTDTLARLGGDEFLFLLNKPSNHNDVAHTALRVVEALKEPFRLQEHVLHLSTSIGIAMYPDDGEDERTLLKNADIAMYNAKSRGVAQYCFYSEDMNQSSMERLSIENHLREAIDKNELTLVYQPQLNTNTNSYRNAEALIRWNSPELGAISPGVFIPIAEETGLINRIDLWVISQACKQLANWREQGFEDITVAVNVSAGHLISASLIEHIKSELIINQLKASQIEVEITEAVFVEQTQRTVESLHALKKLGVRIAIDDFGTGYSSLQYIQDFPTDTLKLDGMFIRDLETNSSSQGIVRSTIILAHSLGLDLVTECVENEFQLNFLKEHGCDLLQGFLLCKPLPPSQVPLFCRTNPAQK